MKVILREDFSGSEQIINLPDDTADIWSVAEDEARDWIADGDHPLSGAMIGVDIWIDDECRTISVEIPPDHDAMIRAAGGDPRCDHDWVGVGGCDQNPGVWSVGGTAMMYHDRCDRCGIMRRHLAYGVQRNRGQSDDWEYFFSEEDGQ